MCTHFRAEIAKAGVIQTVPSKYEVNTKAISEDGRKPTRPLRFQVPMKIVHCLVVEYSGSLF